MGFPFTTKFLMSLTECLSTLVCLQEVECLSCHMLPFVIALLLPSLCGSYYPASSQENVLNVRYAPLLVPQYSVCSEPKAFTVCTGYAVSTEFNALIFFILHSNFLIVFVLMWSSRRQTSWLSFLSCSLEIVECIHCSASHAVHMESNVFIV